MAFCRDALFDDWQNKGDVLSCNRYMLENQLDADVAFVLPGPGDSSVTVRAHKYVLVSRSPVFFAMLNGPLAETKRQIEITDITPEGFWNLLRYMYYEKPTLTFDNVFDVLYAAKKYIVTKLMKLCVSFLENIVAPENACLILDQSLLLEENLEKKCLQIIQRNTKRVLQSETFFRISHFTLCKILQCDRLSLSEVDVFVAVNKWAELQCAAHGIEPTAWNRREVLDGSLSLVHVASLSKEEFSRTVAPSGLLSVREENALLRALLGDPVTYLPFAAGRRQFFACRCVLSYTGYVRHSTGATPLYHGFVRRCRWSITFQCDHSISLHGLSLLGEFQGSISVFQGGQRLLDYSSQVSEKSIKFDSDLYLEAGQFTVVTDATASYSGEYYYRSVHAGPPSTQCDHEEVVITARDCSSLAFLSHLYYTHSHDLLFVDSHFAEVGAVEEREQRDVEAGEGEEAAQAAT